MKTSYSFSPSQSLFYANQLKETTYDPAGIWPADAFEIDDKVMMEFTSPAPLGKKLGTVDGMPAWVDVPPPTSEELIAAAEEQKQTLIDQANEYINSKQWPGKAAIGRLKGDDLEQYNLWLDYLDELEAVDTSTAPDIAWPTAPAV